METPLVACVELPLAGSRGCQHRWPALAVIVGANLLGVALLWLASVLGWGNFWYWLTSYDLWQMAAGTLLLSQFLTLAIWASLSEPRTPLRWLSLLALAATSGLMVALVFIPTWHWQYLGSRWHSWGIIFWELYVNWMLVLCAGVVFLLTADIAAWPLRRMLGCRMAFGDAPRTTPAARGFGLLELFWWVGMAAAGCWLLRAMLENVLAENVVRVLIMLLCIIPPGIAGTVAAFRLRRRWIGLLLTILLSLAYGGLLSGILWTITSISRNPPNGLLAYLLWIPPEVMALAVMISAAATFANASALRWAGARLTWSVPSAKQ